MRRIIKNTVLLLTIILVLISFIVLVNQNRKKEILKVYEVENLTGNCSDYIEKFLVARWAYSSEEEDYVGELLLNEHDFNLNYYRLSSEETRRLKGTWSFGENVLVLRFFEIDEVWKNILSQNAKLYKGTEYLDPEKKEMALRLSYAPLNNPDGSKCYADSYFFTIFNLNFYRVIEE